jgi:hypothetical protein
LGQDDRITRISVGPEEIGKKKGHGDRRLRHGRQASRARRAWKDV